MRVSCLCVLKNLATSAFGLDDSKTKTRYADVFKGRKQGISYREVCNLKCNVPVMSSEVETSQVRCG